MAYPRKSQVTYSDDDLRQAIVTNRSWAGVMRALGRHPTSQGSKRAAQRRVAQLDISTAHFTGQRRWSDDRLREAVKVCYSWNAVMRHIGIASGSPGSLAAVKSHVLRLGLSVEHFAVKKPARPTHLTAMPVDIGQLRRAAPTWAMTWFLLRGCVTAPPVEPAPYDFIADTPDGLQKVQVKSTTRWDNRIGGYVVSVAPRRTHGPHKDVSMPYDPDDIDLFFIVDAAGWMYLIPMESAAGRNVISLNAYTQCRCGRADGLLAGMNDDTEISEAA